MPIENIDIVNNPHYLYSGLLVVAGLVMQTIATGILHWRARIADAKKARLAKLEELLREIGHLKRKLCTDFYASAFEGNLKKQEKANTYPLSNVKAITLIHFNQLNVHVDKLTNCYQEHVILFNKDENSDKFNDEFNESAANFSDKFTFLKINAAN